MIVDGLPGDLIFVNGIEFTGYHGLLPDEQRDGRRYRVDLVLEWPMEAVSRSDDIADTVDYRDLCDRVLELNARQRCNLIERLAVLIAEDILATTPAHACAVTLHKFATDLAAQSVAVRVVRRRAPTGS
jgi:dihydroneopterin aldolase